MRITNKMMTTKYIHSLGKLSYDLDKLNTQVASGRKFSKASENPSAAIKAFQIRRDLSKIEGYQANIEHAKSSLTNAESALSHMEDLMKEANVKILSGVNGTQSEQERAIIATELRNIQDQLFQTLNSSASDVYYFGGTNTDAKPFTLDAATGDLLYNGLTLNTDFNNPLLDPTTVAKRDELIVDSLYVDIGLNVQFDLGNNVDKSTVFEYSIAGINIIGSGVTNMTIEGVSEDIPNNLYHLLGKIAEEFESGTYSSEKANALLGHFQENSSEIVKKITEVGSKTSYLDFMIDRFDSQTLDMQERQMSVEAADPAKTIIQFESQRVAYQAALQMGRQIIQPSIFDFMR